MNSIEQKVETILKRLVRGFYENLPDHNTDAMKAAVRRQLIGHTIEWIDDTSHYYEELFVSEVKAKIDGETYTIKLCFDSGYMICFKNS